jgi:hypothetical protein
MLLGMALTLWDTTQSSTRDAWPTESDSETGLG